LTLTVAPATSTLSITSTAFNQSTATAERRAERCSQWQQRAALSLTVGQYPTRPVPDPPAPALTDSKYIASMRAASSSRCIRSAPLRACRRARSHCGCSRYSTRTSRYQSDRHQLE
jgi:hypothetical protein